MRSVTKRRGKRHSEQGRSIGFLGICLLAIVTVISGMIIYVSEQACVTVQARDLHRLEKEKEALENEQKRLASQIARLEKSERIHRLASEKLDMVCPTSLPADLYSEYFVSADPEARGPHRKRAKSRVALLTDGIIKEVKAATQKVPDVAP